MQAQHYNQINRPSGFVPNTQVVLYESAEADQVRSVVHATGYSVEGQLESYLNEIGANNYEKSTLLHIARLESTYNPNAVNSDYKGIFQYSLATYSYHNCMVYGPYYQDWKAMTRCALQDLRGGLIGQWQVTEPQYWNK